jgi:hypothetical protein
VARRCWGKDQVLQTQGLEVAPKIQDIRRLRHSITHKSYRLEKYESKAQSTREGSLCTQGLSISLWMGKCFVVARQWGMLGDGRTKWRIGAGQDQGIRGCAPTTPVRCMRSVYADAYPPRPPTVVCKLHPIQAQCQRHIITCNVASDRRVCDSAGRVIQRCVEASLVPQHRHGAAVV